METGGIERAVARTADRSFGGLSEAASREARALFLRLVKIGDGPREDVRRPVSRADLLAGSSRPAAVQEVLDAFTASRLLTQAETGVQITHEALLRAWPRLRRWIDDDRPGNRTRQELEEAAAAWIRSGRNRDLLHRGLPLGLEQQWAAGAAPGDLASNVREFLDASAGQARRAGLLRRGAIVTLAALALIASLTAGFAVQQRASAQAQRNNAIFGQVTAEAASLPGTDTSLAAQLDVLAYQLRRTPSTYTGLLSMAGSPLSTPVNGRAGPVYSLAVSQARHLAATGISGGKVQLWSIADPARPARLATLAGPPPAPGQSQLDIIYAVAFTPDGRFLATGNDTGEIQLWNLASTAHPTSTVVQPPRRGTSINALAFSPDGATLAGASTEGTVETWRVAAAGAPAVLGAVHLPGGADAESLAFSPAGRILPTGSSDGKIQLWDSGRRGLARAGPAIPAGGSRVYALSYFPNGNFLVSGGLDLNVRLFDVSDPAHPFQYSSVSGGINPVHAVAFSPDGRIVASSDGSHIQLWAFSVTNGLVALGQKLTGPAGPVTAVAFTPDSRTLVTTSTDGVTRLWRMPAGLVGHAMVRSVAFNPRFPVLASGGQDGSVQLWGQPHARPVQALGAPLSDADGSPVESVAFSPGGSLLAAGTRSGALQLWDVSDLSAPRPLGPPAPAHAGEISSVAFSPRGGLLAVAGQGGLVTLWDVSGTGQTRLAAPPVPDADGSAIQSVAFSPSGSTLAAGTSTGLIQLWSTAQPSRPRSVFSGRATVGETVNSVSFSRRGHLLAEAGQDNAVQLWNVSDPSRATMVGRPLQGTASISAVAMNPDATILAASELDGTVILWNIASPSRPSVIGRLALTGSTRAALLVTSVLFSPDGSSLVIGGGDGALRVLPTSAAMAIQVICAATPGVLTPSRWDQEVSGLPYRPPCPAR